MTYLPRANEPVEPHTHERAADGTWGCPTCIAEEAAAGGGGGGGVGPVGPAGPAGSPGAAGAAATIAVGTTTTGAAGSAATVTNTGSSSAAVFNFKIPAGATGPVGPASTVPGPTGPASTVPGPAGPAGSPGIDGADGVDGVSISIQGAVPTYADLDPAAEAGDCFVVESDGLLYDFDGTGYPPEGSGVPWRGPAGIQGQPGAVGPAGLGISYKGTVDVAGSLPATATSGDLYIVSDPAPAHGFVWDGDTSAWVDAGPVQGPQGVPGPQGESIVGPAGRDGKDGADSTVPGPKGDPGADSTVPGPVGPASTVPGPAGPAGPTAVSADAGNTSVLGTDGKIFTPAGTGGGIPYVLPAATSTTLGGVKVGTGLAVDGTGTLSATVATGFLPTTGGTMTGTITVPTTVQSFTWGTSGYNMFGASGGLAVRSNTTNILNHTLSEVVAYVPITTAGSGIGVRFGSGGPSLSKAGTTIASSAPITVAAAPANPTEVANKAYVDAASGGGVTNPVAGSTAGLTLWTGSQSAYDGIATKDPKTVYMVV